MGHRIISGDRLRITVQEDAELNRVYPVAGDGTIDVGYIGRVDMANMTISEAEDRIQAELEKTFFKKATVSMSVSEFVEGNIVLMGAVVRPGIVQFRSDQILTLMEVVMGAGGFTADAAGTRVRIMRWKPGGSMQRETITVDVQSMLETMDFSKDQYLRPRDIVIVPSLGEKGSQEFLALGDVGSPGFHPCSEGLDVIRAIMRAGGISRVAKWSAARLLRPDKSGNYSVIPLDLSRLFGAADMTQNVKVMPGDILFVPSAEQATRGQITLLGEVSHKGSIALPLDQDITLARTILGTGGVTQFGNDSKVKIMRTAPDGSKQTLVVDVARILKLGTFEDDVPLENGDIIIVPEKILGF
ncbi:MAG: polysaccharide biosynthesis/export family protein [Pseudomonadota bacterium]